MDSLKLNKYKLAGLVCKTVFDKLKHEICINKRENVSDLIQLGNKLLIDECKSLSEKYNLKNFIKNIKIGFPTCISLNNCSGYYVHENNYDKYNYINKEDLVKIELGLNIDDCINIYGDSFYILPEKYEENKEMFNLLNKLEHKILKKMKVGKTNDDIKILIESLCTEYDSFPVENSLSFQHIDNHIQTDESKYIVTNYRKYYDEDDCLIVKPDICFDLEENEVFTINLTLIKNKLDDSDHIYTELHKPHIYKYNEYFHNFKLQSSKQFYSLIKKNHGTNPFSMIDYNDNIKNRIGFKESFDNGIINQYTILYNKEKLPIYFKKFTLMVGKEKGIILNEL